MELDDLVNRSLALGKPWRIEGAEIVEESRTVEIRVTYDGNEGPCPECGRMSKRYDSNERRWGHLDSSCLCPCTDF